MRRQKPKYFILFPHRFGIIELEMSKTWPKGKSGEGKQEQIAEQPAKKSAKAKRGREPSW